MHKSKVKINDDATKASVSYLTKRKNKLTVVFSYLKDVRLEYAEDPQGHPTMVSRGVELIADVYIQTPKQQILSKINKNLGKPTLIASKWAWIKHKYTEYGKEKLMKNDPVDLWQNLHDIKNFSGNPNPEIDKLIRLAQKDVLEFGDQWWQQKHITETEIQDQRDSLSSSNAFNKEIRRFLSREK